MKEMARAEDIGEGVCGLRRTAALEMGQASQSTAAPREEKAGAEHRTGTATARPGKELHASVALLFLPLTMSLCVLRIWQLCQLQIISFLEQSFLSCESRSRIPWEKGS